MAVIESQRYPSYFHSSDASSPHWERVKPEPVERNDGHSFSTQTPSPTVSRPSALRQTLLNFSPRTENAVEYRSANRDKDSEVINRPKPVTVPKSASNSDLYQTKKEEKCPSLIVRSATCTKVSKTGGKRRGRPCGKKKDAVDKSGKPSPSVISDSQTATALANRLEGQALPALRSPKKNARYATNFQRESDGKRQTQLTTYGIRRTARQFQKEQEKEREANVLSLLKSKTESGMKIIFTDDKGRGIVATRTFYDGEYVVEYAGELITEKVAKKRESKYREDAAIGSYMFYFVHNGQKYCVDATEETPRLGRLINHSRLRPNCVVKVIPLDGVPRLVLFAKQMINPGEELLYDYGDRDKETLEAHPWLKT